ncbi:9881_t:CDS:2, partial [Diversispora eburnea]
QALPYGGMPSSALNRKMEETDPLLIDAIAQVDTFHDQEDYYIDYARGQIVDRRLEESWLEIANPVRHPELSLVQAMGVNADTQVPERSWSKQAIRIGRNKIHNQLKDSTHVFSTQREVAKNTLWGNYHPYNELVCKYTNSGNNAPPYVPWRHIMGETELPVQKYGKVPDSYTTSLKYRNIMLQKPDQPWNLQQYANTTGLHIAPSKDKNIMLQKSDQSWSLQQDVNGTRHIPFNMYMILATKGMVQTETEFGQNKNFQLTKPGGASLIPAMHSKEQKGDQQLVLPSSFEKSIPKNSRELILPSNPYPLSEMQHEDQQRRLSLQDLTSHSETFRRPILTSNSYPMSRIQHEEQERHLTLQDITSHTVTFRRPILTSDPYSIDEMQREDQERNLPLQDVTFNTGIFRRPILPSDLEFLYWQQQEDQNRNFVPSSQKLHPAKGVLPAIYSEKAVQGSLVSNAFPNAHLANIAGHIGDATVLGNSEETVFGSNASGGYGTAPTGPKTLRAYKESDSMNLHDGL